MPSDRGADEVRGAQGPRDGQAAADRGIRLAEQPDEGAYAICAINSRGWVTQ